MAAVNAHMAAINSRRGDQMAESVWFPFLHMQPNGDKARFESAADLPEMSTAPFKRSEIQALEILATSGAMLLYSLTFQRYGDDDEPIFRVQAPEALHQIGDEWKVGWRQYLGEV